VPHDHETSATGDPAKQHVDEVELDAAGTPAASGMQGRGID
jgi:hypothetical protein